MTKLNNLKLFLAFAIIIFLSSCWAKEPYGSGNYVISIYSLDGKENVELKVNVPKSIFRASIYTYNLEGAKEFPTINGDLLDRSFDANKLFSIENKSDKSIKVFVKVIGGVYKKDEISYNGKDFEPAMTNKNFIEKVKENDKEWLLDYWNKLNQKNKYLAIEIEPHSTYNVPWTI